jgi:hypothetical protein
MRVVVFGGRDFDDRRWLYRVLDAVHVDRLITCIIEGEMSGADLLARAWEVENAAKNQLLEIPRSCAIGSARMAGR